VGDIYLDVFVEVSVPNVAFQCKGFPLAGERDFYDAVNERVIEFVQMCWYGVSDNG